MYREVIFKIEKRERLTFPKDRTDHMNDFRHEHETRFDQEDPQTFLLGYLLKKKLQIEDAIEDHYDQVPEDQKDKDLEIGEDEKTSRMFAMLKVLGDPKIQDRIGEDLHRLRLRGVV